ncbi:carboxylesterase family protein [Stipitochalara longipes BDJ]|nr:carboxylesterase family protein [Stipitochalara longipes BDJ]
MTAYTLLLTFLSLTTAVRAQDPQLRLPWGTWEAKPLPQDPNIYLFKNVRFGAQPERFGAPSFPEVVNDTIQEITGELSCIQISTAQLKQPPGGSNPLGDEHTPSITQTEDCLFLDLYLPVTVWIYGGAYAFGSKSQFGPLYTGQSIIAASGYQTIFVAGNYRVGALGWLAGNYMESVAQPNAGLYDQALLFEWVSEFISLVGGDNNQVSAWGESAGAGSILHHLIRGDGTFDPLFQTFVAQSPAFEWAWDNSPGGKLDQTFASFSQLAKCDDFDISCLREASVETIQAANQQLFNVVTQTGLFPVGPAVDGQWIKSIPAVALSQNKVWPHIQSGIISHCANEAYLFVLKGVDSEEDFNDYLALFLPGDDLSPQRDAIRQQYDCIADFDGNFTACVKDVIQDLSFTCNTRQLFDSYPEISFMMEYAFPSPSLAVHASDLIPLFMNSMAEAVSLLEFSGLSKSDAYTYAGILSIIAPRYQNYFASFALSGDPNSLPFRPTIDWPIADGSNDKLSRVMKVGLPSVEKNAFQLGSDDQNSKSKCNFWIDIAKSIDSTFATAAAETLGSQNILLKQDSGPLKDL